MVGGYQIIDLTKYEMPEPGSSAVYKNKIIAEQIRNLKPTLIIFNDRIMRNEVWARVKSTGAYDGTIKIIEHPDSPITLTSDDDNFTIWFD